MTKTLKKNLSICIPTYNRVNFLKESLQSITKQFTNSSVYSQTEVVISDNNSSDRTKDLVRSFQRKYKNIKYFKNKKNIGAHLNFITFGFFLMTIY